MTWAEGRTYFWNHYSFGQSRACLLRTESVQKRLCRQNEQTYRTGLPAGPKLVIPTLQIGRDRCARVRFVPGEERIGCEADVPI
jgi:hypothetical protein